MEVTDIDFRQLSVIITCLNVHPSRGLQSIGEKDPCVYRGNKWLAFFRYGKLLNWTRISLFQLMRHTSKLTRLTYRSNTATGILQERCHAINKRTCAFDIEPSGTKYQGKLTFN